MAEAVMNGCQIYHGFLSGYMNIAGHREHMNRINVFPVPDGDTGSNMIRTFRAIVKDLESSRSAGKVLEHIADLSLEGARGNSGIILSQYLNGLAGRAGRIPLFTSRDFGQAVRDSVEDAYRAMENPMEGTILTVIRAWAETIYTESLRRIPMNELLSRGFAAARSALEKTTDQLQVLKENRVVDAGAWGFVSFLEGIEKLNRDGPVPLSVRKSLEEPADTAESAHETEPAVHTGPQDLRFRYCTEVLLEKNTAGPDKIRRKLRPLGDSLIVGQGRNRLRVHIHCNQPDEVVRLLRRYGRVVQQKADDMVRQEQVVNRRIARIAVLTDSIADIPREILDRYQIHVLNLKLTWEDEEFLDRLTLTPEEFYRQQAVRSSFPGSSVPGRSRVDSVFQYLMEHYDGLIALPVGKALSGTWQQMQLAAEPWNREGKRIEVIDTCLDSAAQGLLAAEVARAAAEGRGLDELKQLAETLKKRVKIYVTVSTFKYMVKGGRVSPLKGFLATLLNLKPIVSLDEQGRGIAFDKAFSRKGLMKKTAALMKETVERNGIVRYAVVHAAAPEKAAEFAALAEAVTGKKPDYITAISPIVGMHSGKGAVAVGILEGM